jgi:hypothetical protein
MVLFSASGVFAADQTWVGKISDSMCGLSHKAMMEHDKKLTDRTCTEACVKAGAKYVFASNGKVYMIENQSDPALVTHAGHTVRLTGAMNGDTITVSNIRMPAAKKTTKKS